MIKRVWIIISMLIVASKISVYGKNVLINSNDNNTIFIHNRLLDSSLEKKKQNQSSEKTYYDMNYNIIDEGLFWENGEIIYIENGKRCFDCEKNGNIGVNFKYDVKVDKVGNTIVNYKKKQIEIKNGIIKVDADGKRTLEPIKGMYFSLDYSKHYGMCDGELFLLGRNDVIIEDYKNEFHDYTLNDSLNEIKNSEWADGANMPEDQIAKNVRFDFKGEMNIRPHSETYYFYENHSLAYDGVKEINGKKYLFNKRGVLVKNGYYSDKDGVGYISDSNGVVIEKEGFYVKKPYDENGNLDIDASFIYLVEATNSKRHYDKIYYVNSNGNVDSNKLFMKDDSVYYSKINGELLRNSYLTNLYYFGNDCKLSNNSESIINKNNIDTIQSFINVLLSNHKYSDFCVKVVDVNKYNKQKEKNKIVDLNENVVVEKDYFTIIKRDERLYIGNKYIVNAFVYYCDDYTEDESYNIRGRYYDSNGYIVKNKTVNLGDDIYLIDKDGCALVGYKLTDGIINKYFKGDAINKIKEYENYFTDDTGKLLVEYNDICKTLKEKIIKELNLSASKKDENLYIKEINEVVSKYNDEEINENIDYFEDIEEMPNVLKTKLIDLDKDGKNELLVFRKEKYRSYEDMYFLILDLYEYKNKFVLVQSEKLQYLFYRDYGLVKVGFKLNQFGEYRMYVELRQNSGYRGDGSFVVTKYYDFKDLNINLKFGISEAG